MAEGSKTEKATPKKRRDERKKGNVFLSQDAVAVVTLLGSFSVFWMMSGRIAEQLTGFMRFCFTQVDLAGGLAVDDMLRELTMQALGLMARTVLPITLVTAGCAVVATFAQTRLLVSGELMKPKFNRINPLEGFKRLFSLKSVINALKGILKISILMVIVYFSIENMFHESAKYLYVDLRASCTHLFSQGVSMVVKIALAFIALAALDILYQWWDYERQIRMSKQEIKEEYKQTEGDPQIKGKIKEMQRKRAQSRMMQQVPQADVVIRNPTHFAVALRYHPDEDAAPIVLAKGQDSLALRIVKVAEEHKVAVIENVPLARALYADAELDREIPPALYNPVAEVLVYIFRLNEKNKLVK
ncbi:flagellar biosynthesis protein FlhB [uncultured Oscillibacter sp.]|uniref:flagellar biosynthesis protein FlhB n=1 Tax=uncultured Oscillibacter sp. TaxID=876091 RepID=UPI0025E5E59E|nr:flagellar biosynthesis protein FlhB [uncultured Oscillibacter sp.]